MEQHGLKEEELSVSRPVLVDIIRYYTRESGVRNLEREIAKICRKSVKQLALDTDRKKVTVTVKNLDNYLGVRRFRYGVVEEENEIGQVTGLAWTEVGGELLRIEATLMPGKGRLTQTGQLGDVMQESIQAAMTVVRSRAEKLGIDPGFHQNLDAHVHVPEGATPKDGPSAGIAMCTALVSALTRIPVRADVAMTGEITLRGKVLPIGGLKEKLLAAHRGGIKLVLIPDENEKDLAEIPKAILRKLEVKAVSTIDEVLQLALTDSPKPLPAPIEPKKSAESKKESTVTTH
jgi:ATP-dependent Lon protease